LLDSLLQEIKKMARGRNRGHKGGRKQYSNPDQIKEDLAKAEEKKRWREAHPDSSSEESEDEEPIKGGKKEKGDSDVSFESSSSSSESESEDENAKKKGVAGMIEVENPNRVKQRMKKASELDTKTGTSDKPQLSRREREELEKQKAKAHYQKMHAQGKTDEARADLARLAIIRKQREEAAAKRVADQKSKEDASKAKLEATNKALGRKK